MNFDDLEKRMRVFEQAHDQAVLPGLAVVARLDGRGFTKLTKSGDDFERPFDEGFRDAMLETAAHLMARGFRAVYGYTQSDEISLLLHRDEEAFGRRLAKLTSVLAGEASARFSLALGRQASFDCRIAPLPDAETVCDYFRWRSEDGHRNALGAHAYWLLRGQGHTAAQATRAIKGLSAAEKNELLFQGGINFNDLPAWQKRGAGLYWQDYEKAGRNPKTGEARSATRRRLVRDLELPLKEAYSAFLRQRIAEAGLGQ